MSELKRRIPWGRVLVEGVVIVGSILLAFVIDAWWDGALERSEEQEVLSSLVEDFTANKAEAVSVISTHERSNRLVERMTSIGPQELLEESTDSLTAMVGALATPRTFDPIRGNVDALISSGKLGIISDPELRGALTSFLNMVEDAKGDESYVSQFAMKVWEAEVQHGGPWRIDIVAVLPGSASTTDISLAPAPTPSDVIRLREDEELMSLSRWTRVLGSRYIGEIRRISAQIDTILALLDRSRLGDPRSSR